MATGYVRQSAADIVSGEVVRAAPLNNEFNAIRDAFSTASGHNHDGTTGGGAYISTVSDSDNDTKVVADGATNSVQVSTAGTERMRVGSNGRVGIGRTAGGATLDVQSSGSTIIRARGASGAGQGAGFYFTVPDSEQTMGAFSDRATAFGGTPGQLASIYTPVTIPLTFDVAGAERMRIDASGATSIVNTLKIGNGAASNSARLMVNTLSGTAAGIQLFQDGNESWVMESVPGSTALRWSNSGAERMRLDGVGNVGINTNAPGSTLDMRGPNGLGVRYIETATGNTNRIQFGTGAGFGYIDATAGIGSPSLVLQTASTERMRIDASGNVGIGRTPNYTLDVGGSMRSLVAGGGTLLLGDSQNTVAIRSIPGAGDSGLGFYTQALAGNAERMRIDASGNVGVGGAPNAALHIQRTSANAELRLSTFTSGNPTLRLNAEGVNGGSIAYDRATSVLAFENGGVTAARIDSSGNVGIGVTPLHRLHSLAAADGAVSLGIGSGTGDTANGSRTTEIRALSGNGTFFQNLNIQANEIRALTVGSERMRIDSSGNVGIGTTAPDVFGRFYGGTILGISKASGQSAIAINSATGSAFLEMGVGGTRYGAFTVSATDTQVSHGSTLILATNSVNRVTIDSTGNVGVGITPSNRLHAGGITRISDATNSTAVTIDPVTTAGTTAITAQFGGSQLTFGTAGTERVRIDGSGNLSALRNVFVAGELTLQRQDTSVEGGQVNFTRASDNANAWAIDAHGSGSTPSLRFINVAGGSTTPLVIDASGNVISNVNTTAPTLSTNQQMVFALTSNTNLRISVRGTDGVTRVANITLA